MDIYRKESSQMSAAVVAADWQPGIFHFETLPAEAGVRQDRFHRLPVMSAFPLVVTTHVASRGSGGMNPFSPPITPSNSGRCVRWYQFLMLRHGAIPAKALIIVHPQEIRQRLPLKQWGGDFLGV